MGKKEFARQKQAIKDEENRKTENKQSRTQKRALIVLQGHSFVFSIQELSNSSTLNPSLDHPQTKKEGAALMRLTL
jgi:hypothetical protein